MLNALRRIFGRNAPCTKHDEKTQQSVMGPKAPEALSTSRERSRSRSSARSKEKCTKSKQKSVKAKHRAPRKQVRLKHKVEHESDDDKSLDGFSDECAAQYEELIEEEEDECSVQSSSPVRPKKRARRRRAATPDDDSCSIDIQSEDGDDCVSEASSTATEAPTTEPVCSKRTRARRKTILKKCAAPRGRPRQRSRPSGRSRIVRSHIHTLEDHDRGSKCRLCTTCAARYQAILMNGRYA